MIDVSRRPTEAQLLAAGLEHSSDAIVFVDHAGVVTHRNTAADKTFGLTGGDSELTGSFDELFPPERREEMVDVLARASLGRAARTTTVAIRSDGSRLIVEATCAAVGSAAGGTASDYVVVFRDVTEPMLIRAAAAAVAFEPDASAALESLAVVLGHVVPVENLTVAAVEGVVARHVASAGNEAAKLQGDQILSIAWTPLAAGLECRHPVVCHDTRMDDLPYNSVLAEAGIRSYVLLPLFHGGRIAATLNVGFARPGAPTPSVVGLLSSLTTSVMPIVLNLVTLEEQTLAIRQLERFDSLRNDFLALITHEMRTPLAVINGFAEQLRDRWSELPDAEKLDNLDAMLRNSRHVYRLVEEALEIARLESGGFAYELRSLALEDEVKRTVADLPPVDAGRIRVRADRELPNVRCDPDRHWQVLMNLLSNALKFSAPHAAVDVELTRRDSVVEVAVRDHGAGIEPGDLPRLFQKFSRVGTQEIGSGSGLGLYVSKAMIEAQGGHMWAQSEPGRGSTFVYALPAASLDDN